jgi:hypothetical protein
MKVSHHLARLEPLVLYPLHGISDGDWHRAPRGRWTIAQIVQHLAVGVDLVAGAFTALAESGAMKRRRRPHETVLRHLVLGIGRIPGGLRAPSRTKPDDKPNPELAAAQFRMGVERLKELSSELNEERQLSLFVRHPMLGDLNFPEWARFHYLHCREHAGQIGDRLRWLGK